MEFKNDTQRREWLRNYQAWGIWYKDDHIGATYYKYVFDNGARLVVDEYETEVEAYGGPLPINEAHYHLIGGPEPPVTSAGIPKWTRHDRYTRFGDSETEIVNFLRTV